MGFTNLSLPNKVTKLTIVNLLIVRNSNKKKLTTFSNNKMVCNKITFVFVLVGLISVASMVSSAPTDPPTDAPTTKETAAPTTSVTEKAPDTTTNKDAPTNSSEKPTKNTDPTEPTDPTGSPVTGDPTGSPVTGDPTTPTGGAGCPKITYGMLFSVISAILLFSA